MTEWECNICKTHFPESELITGHGIRHEIEDLIRQDFPDWHDGMHICKSDFEIYRNKYVSSLIQEEIGNIKELERDVLRSIKENEIISTNSNNSAGGALKTGDRIADKVAQFGGSWKSIITFFVILAGWIAVNSHFILQKPFDPYPFILMNLILSCLAAIQAPIIMMSQNRQETKDRIRAENDYKVNLKAEIEIRTLHEKVDHLLLDQWSKMMQIQEMQIEMLEEIRNRIDKTQTRP